MTPSLACGQSAKIDAIFLKVQRSGFPHAYHPGVFFREFGRTGRGANVNVAPGFKVAQDESQFAFSGLDFQDTPGFHFAVVHFVYSVSLLMWQVYAD